MMTRINNVIRIHAILAANKQQKQQLKNIAIN